VSPRRWPDRVRDILDAIDEIEDFTGAMDYEQFAADRRTFKAALADFSIIGEAARHIPDDVAAAHPRIPWRQIRDMRNVIVHAYFGVEPKIVWKTIREDLPALRTQLEELLRSEGPNAKR